MQRPLFIGATHVFDSDASAYLGNITPDGRLTDPVKIQKSVHDRNVAAREENFSPLLRRMTSACVTNRDVEFFYHEGTDAGPKLLDFLCDYMTKHDLLDDVPFERRHPCMFVGFDVENVLAIAAANTARIHKNIDYWTWTRDERRPDWFLDPYQYIVRGAASRELMPRDQVLQDFGYAHVTPFGGARDLAAAAKHLAWRFGLCL